MQRRHAVVTTPAVDDARTNEVGASSAKMTRDAFNVSVVPVIEPPLLPYSNTLVTVQRAIYDAIKRISEHARILEAHPRCFFNRYRLRLLFLGHTLTS